MADQTPGIWPCCMGENICEEYYGWRCIVCGTFYAFGCEPWILGQQPRYKWRSL